MSDRIAGFSYSAIAFGCALALVVSAAAFLISRRLTRPIRRLAVLTRDIAGGNFDQRVDVSTRDEVGELADALKVMLELGEDAVVVTVFPDDNKKYLSTDLLRREPVKDGYLSPHVRLSGYRAFKRVCHTCCVPEECAESPPPGFLPEFEGFPFCPRRSR